MEDSFLNRIADEEKIPSWGTFVCEMDFFSHIGLSSQKLSATEHSEKTRRTRGENLGNRR
jgi:hypothetical protein